MDRNAADFTLTFRGLCDAAGSRDADATLRTLFRSPEDFDEWAIRWRHRLGEENGSAETRPELMRAVNPAFIPRNHLVEEAISAAESGNFSPFETLLAVLSTPYGNQPGFSRYSQPPSPEQVVHQTFCGT
jgi:serine/tyrosine/threonine adenylyltransferase